MIKKSNQSTTDLKNELQTIFEWFESEDLDVDLAVEKYRRGSELIKELKARLETAKNEINKVGL